jgi:hypothetical protein
VEAPLVVQKPLYAVTLLGKTLRPAVMQKPAQEPRIWRT